MRRSHRVLVVGVLAAAVLASGCSKQASRLTGPAHPPAGIAPLVRGEPSHVVPNRYLVVFRKDVTNADARVSEMEATHGFKASHRFRSAVRGFAGALTAAMVERLRNDPRVSYIEEEQTYQVCTTQPGATWGIDRIDQPALPLGGTYTYERTGSGVDAYIIDTGIRLTHDDFGGRAVTGVDVITPGGTADDPNGHGTHVAGTVGGTVHGVAKGVRLIAVRVLGASGSGSTSSIVAGLDWVASHHTTTPAVANMSLIGSASTTLDNAVLAAINDGVTFCVAAGNSGAPAANYSPARVEAAITVGATSSSDAFASWSNYGSCVDVSAPGVSITSDYHLSNTATATMSGTSAASPHVAGVAALYLEANPWASPAAVASAIAGAATAGVISDLKTGTPDLLLYSWIPSSAPPPPPAAPSLSSPADGATGIQASPTLSWCASPGAVSYGVQVATDVAFSAPAQDLAGLAGTSTTLPELAAGVTYYWRVNAAGPTGTSAWSAAFRFTTFAGSAPSAPELTSPANGATNVSRTPTLAWSASTGATSYRVQVSTSPAFSTLTRDDAAVAGTSVTLATALARRTYFYWRVCASNVHGTSPWSGVRSFRTRN